MNVPISLREASTVVLRGNISVSALRAEARRGNLTTFKIGKNVYTTQAHIEEMMERCRVQPNQPASTTENQMTDGSFETEDETSGPDALDLIVDGLKKNSPLTSATRRLRGLRGEVVPMKSPSRRS